MAPSDHDDTAIGGPQRAFPQTLWTMVLRAKGLALPERRDALQKLIEAYWKPVYCFIRRRGNSPENAKDLTQGFFTALLDRNFLQYVERDRGRFRTFLLTTLEHFLADEFDRAQAQKRGGGIAVLALDFEEAESRISAVDAGETPDAAFRREWAVRVMVQAVQGVRRRYESGRLEEFNLLHPHLTEATASRISYPQLAETLNISEGEARKRVHRLRVQFREVLLEVIRSYAETEEDVQEEVRDLFSAFS